MILARNFRGESCIRPKVVAAAVEVGGAVAAVACASFPACRSM